MVDDTHSLDPKYYTESRKSERSNATVEERIANALEFIADDLSAMRSIFDRINTNLARM